MILSLRQVHKSFGCERVVHDVSLDIPAGQMVTLLGPSGCGKTTLLRLMAGLAAPDRGQVLIGGEDAAGWDFRRRRIGFVFQNYALFPHMDVAANISFGLRVKPRGERLARAAMAKRVAELLELVQLSGFGARFPHQLSGGQRQRVAIARALAIEPRLLLLDEPFGALDARVRAELRLALRDLQQRLQISCVLVTHDQEEARVLSDQVVLLNSGRIDQHGSVEAVFQTPQSAFARTFLGLSPRLVSL